MASRLSLDTTGSDPRISVTPGYGISANGQDVVLLSALKTNLATLPVIDPVTSEELYTFQQHVLDPTNTTHAGILILQPVIAQVSGQTVDTGTGPIEVSGNIGASCDQDPEEYAFEDWQIADAVRLVYLPWPVGIPNLVLPALAPSATWRNRLAYAIFEAESLLGPDDQFPWAMLGAPVALIGFDPGIAWAANTQFTAGQFITDPNGNVQQVQTAGESSGAPPVWNTRYGQTTTDNGVTWINAGGGWRPLFVDCSAVVRSGGLPRSRNVFPTQTAVSLVWQPDTALVVGDFVLDANNNVQKVQTAGTTAPFEPVWKTAFGQTTGDGGVTWISNGPGSWQPNTSFAAGQFIYDELGYQQTVQSAGTSGINEPDWNGVYLPTSDGTVTWVNNGSGNPPVIQPALAQARVAQLSEQFGQTLASNQAFHTLADIFTTLPPSGILPAGALDFVNKKNLWFPPNWSITAAPVHLEELETVLQTGITAALIDAETTAPEDASLLEPIEVLVPLPDQVYDPDILVTETVAAVFQNEVDSATDARNATLQRLRVIQQELNTLYNVTSGNASSNPNLIDPDAGLTSDEITGRNTPPPYLPASSETFGTLAQLPWTPSIQPPPRFIIDTNGNLQMSQVLGETGTQTPLWNTTIGGETQDGPTSIWINNGPLKWQPNTFYGLQVIVDPKGNMQYSFGGTSAAEEPAWQEGAQQTTTDGIVWLFSGKGQWQDDTVYQPGQLILDSNGNVQIVKTGGISGDWPPAWNTNKGQTTQDNGVTWANLGHTVWQPTTSYSTGQAIVDPAGNIQLANVGGTSSRTQPSWNDGGGTTLTTLDGSLKWLNGGTILWQASTSYALNQIIIDANGNIQVAQTAGTSGTAQPILWNTQPGIKTSDGTVIWTISSFYSTDLSALQNAAAQAPYTLTYSAAELVNNQTTQVNRTITLIDADDWAYLANYGLQHFITRLNAKVSQANDILDTAFLTVQTDIYRYRQNVLGSTAASSLATSPILANIATGQTAAATSENLQSYINFLIPPAGSTALPPVFTQGFGAGSPSLATPASSAPVAAASTRAQSVQTRTVIASHAAATPATGAVKSNVAIGAISDVGKISQIGNVSQAGNISQINQINQAVNIGQVGKISQVGNIGQFGTTVSQIGITDIPVKTVTSVDPILKSGIGLKQIDPTSLTLAGTSMSGLQVVSTNPTQIIFPGVNTVATSTDITSQSPIAGAQLNLRTLTIAERLQQSPSQEAMFYSIGNRLSLLQLLQTLEITIDDLPILVDSESANGLGGDGGPVINGVPSPPEVHTFSEWFDSTAQKPAALQTALATKIQSPLTPTNSAEATLFSVGVRVVEQHSMLLRALEARVQLYVDFINLCTTSLNSIQGDVQQAKVLIQQLKNNLAQERQNVAFTTALLADETQRVASVNAQRTEILQSSVQLIAYTRARTLQPVDLAPTRQLVPANVANPVPACLQQSVSIPPELREIVGMLREAPVSWLPAVQTLVSNLERPSLLQELAFSTQARAVLQLQLPQLPSSASGESRVYAKSISTVYTSNQQMFRTMQTQRAAVQPAAMNSLSWSLQVATVQSFSAVNDLISSEAVHTEISNATARLIQQISSVATCLYARAGNALPVDRLAWAEYLSGPGASVQLTSLAILPSWNDLAYTDRQQMQLLVDWLFQQINTTYTQAVGFMSDVVRTAILLASDVPVDTIIPAGIIVRTKPVIGGVVSLNLASSRISSGMYVNLYSGADLAARAVVSDLDKSTVSATVTDVYKPGATLETTDIAHFTAQTPQAVALKPFLRLA